MLDTSGLSPVTLELHQTVGGSATSGAINGFDAEEVANWFFFDIVGAVANDQFALNIASDGTFSNQAAIGGLTFDSIADAPAVPEPSTFVLAALGLAGLGLVAWRRRK